MQSVYQIQSLQTSFYSLIKTDCFYVNVIGSAKQTNSLDYSDPSVFRFPLARIMYPWWWGKPQIHANMMAQLGAWH